MAVTNAYCTLAQLKSELGISDTTDDGRLEISIDAASRQIDGYCGRRFWQDASVVAYTFYIRDRFHVWLDADISTSTGLVVKTDDNDDGTFETTWTIITDFTLLPLNAGQVVPAEPWREIRAVSSSKTFPLLHSGRPALQVTAKWGWVAVPDDIEKACLIQAADLFKAKDAAFGVAGGLEFGQLRVGARLNALARALADPFRILAAA